MRAWIIGLLTLAVGCNGGGDTGDTDTGDTGSAVVDLDGDGYPADLDCDDLDATINPGAEDTWYDGVDQDCGGQDDFDQDGDGVLGGEGNPDCADTDAGVYPGADETCNAIDDDCDGDVDEDAVDAAPVYADLDEDGWGAGQAMGGYCDAPVGTSMLDGDCDDTLAERSPGAPEVCDGVDNDCDGYTDDAPTDGERYYADRDGDGFGAMDGGALACAQPIGYVTDGSDCDDEDEASHPGATELCDLEDNDCDGDLDEGATDPRVYFLDGDADGYGDPSSSAEACGAPTGYVENDRDCDDADGARSPGATETCDGIDNDCDGVVDSDSPDAVAYHPDADGDGYGSASVTTTSCEAVEGWLTDASDCDDADADEHPGVAETCDGDDDDCDGTADESDAIDADAWYIDADADGYGDPTVTAAACSRPSGYSDNDEDCDDAVAASNPGARESCDGVDNDCDTETDEDDAYDATSWYVDADGDGYGDPSTTDASCTAPAGHVSDGSDCDDDDVAVNPAAGETRDLSDEDCDGYVDETFVVAGDIVVTEFARQPYTGGTGLSANAQAQWFEVHNTSAWDVDLANWYVEEQVGDHFYVSPDAALVVPAGGYAVLCYDDQWFADPGDCDYTWGDTVWGTSDAGNPYYDTTYYFDRDDDLVALYLGGTLMDQVDWELAASGGDTWPRTARYAARLDDNALDVTSNDDPGSWCNATASTYSTSGTGSPDYGTPGEANGSCD